MRTLTISKYYCKKPEAKKHLMKEALNFLHPKIGATQIQMVSLLTFLNEGN